MAIMSEGETGPRHRLSTRQGWIVVAGAYGVMFATFGVAYSFSVSSPPFSKTFGASRGEVSLIFSIAVPLYYLVGVYQRSDRGPVRLSSDLLSGVVIGGAGLIFAAHRGRAVASLSRLRARHRSGHRLLVRPVVAAVQRWFVRRRGFASGIAVSGIGWGRWLSAGRDRADLQAGLAQRLDRARAVHHFVRRHGGAFH